MDEPLDQISHFIHHFHLINNLLQPTITTLITFDHTAYQTAQQIFNENVHQGSKQSIQLKNKTHLLMKVLQFQQQPLLSSISLPYQYSSVYKQNFNKHHQSHLQQSKAITQKPEPIKKVKKHGQTKIPQQLIKPLPRKPNNKKKIKQTLIGDQNIDHSNFHNESKGQLKQSKRHRFISYKEQPKTKQYEEFTKKEIQNRNNCAKIAELKKLQYRRQTPLLFMPNLKQQLDSDKQLNSMHLQKEQKNTNNCQDNCIHIRHQCCCCQNSKWHAQSNQRCSTRCETMEKRVNQFQLRSPDDTDSVQEVLGLTGESLRKSDKNRNCSRLQRVSTKSNHHKLKTQTAVTTQLNQWQLARKPLYKTDEDNTYLPYSSKHHHLQPQPFQPKQLKPQLQLNKKQLYNIAQDELQMITSRQNLSKQHKPTTQLLSQKQSKQLQSTLLTKLKKQFSSFNFQYPTEDELKVNQQIKQLQIKLTQLNQKDKFARFNDNCTPKTKVVKLDISPNRNNGHKILQNSFKNQQFIPRSSSIIIKSGLKIIPKKQ